MKRKITRPFKYEIPKTLSQSIYSYLKESIVKNELKPNQKIDEKEVANNFGVSRTPVREAVLRLAAEGFVKITSHRESVVREVSYKELKDIFQVIGVLDSFAMTSIVDVINPDELIKVEKMTVKMKNYFQLNEVEKFIDVNYAIHDLLWDNLTDINNYLQKTLRQCIIQIRLCYYALNTVFRRPEILERSMNAHEEIMEALKTKNKKKLKIITLEHWIPPLP